MKMAGKIYYLPKYAGAVYLRHMKFPRRAPPGVCTCIPSLPILTMPARPDGETHLRAIQRLSHVRESPRMRVRGG